MFEKPIVSVLVSVLGQYVDNLHKDSFEVSMWSGRCVLSSLRLKKDVLMRFGVPLLVESSVIERIELIVPWNSLRTKAVECRVRGVSVHCVLSPVSTEASDDETERASKAADLKTFEDARLAAEKELGQATGGMLARLREAITRNLLVELFKIELTLDFPAAFANDPPSRLRVRLGSLSVFNTDDEWNATTRCAGDLLARKMLLVSDAGATLQVGGDSEPQPLLHPLGLTARIRVATERALTSGQMAAWAAWDVRLGRVAATLTYDHLCALVSVAHFLDQKTYVMKFRRMRPALSVSASPRTWLQYAARCVVLIMRATSRKKWIARGEKRIATDYVLMHKMLTREVHGVPVTWHGDLTYTASTSRGLSTRYYRIVEHAFPTYRLIAWRRRAYVELAEELETHVSAEDRTRARAEIAARNAGWMSAPRRVGGAIWGAAAWVGTGVSSILPQRRSRIDREIARSVGSGGRDTRNGAAAASTAGSGSDDSNGSSSGSDDDSNFSTAQTTATAASEAAVGERAADAPAVDTSMVYPRTAVYELEQFVLVLRHGANNLAQLSAENLAGDVVMDDGTFTGPIAFSATLRNFVISDETPAAAAAAAAAPQSQQTQHLSHPAAASRPVFATSSSQRAMTVKLRRFTPESDISYELSVSFASAGFTVKHRWVVRMMQFLSMPSTLHRESLDSRVTKVLQTSGRREMAQRFVDASPRVRTSESLRRSEDGRPHDGGTGPDRGNDTVGSSDSSSSGGGSGSGGGDGATRGASQAHGATATRRTVWRISLDVGGQTIIFPEEDSVQQRCNGIVWQLGRFQAQYLTASQLNLSLSNSCAFVGVAESGSVLKRVESIIGEWGLRSETAIRHDRLETLAHVDPIQLYITRTSLLTLAKVGVNLTHLSEQREVLSDGIALIGYELGGPIFHSGGDTLNEIVHGRDEELQWEPCELMLRTEGVGAMTVLEIGHNLADGTRENIFVRMRSLTRVEDRHHTIDSPLAITLVIPQDGCPGHTSKRYTTLYLRARRPDLKRRLLRLLSDSIAAWQQVDPVDSSGNVTASDSLSASIVRGDQDRLGSGESASPLNATALSAAAWQHRRHLRRRGPARAQDLTEFFLTLNTAPITVELEGRRATEKLVLQLDPSSATVSRCRADQPLAPAGAAGSPPISNSLDMHFGPLTLRDDICGITLLQLGQGRKGLALKLVDIYKSARSKHTLSSQVQVSFPAFDGRLDFGVTPRALQLLRESSEVLLSARSRSVARVVLDEHPSAAWQQVAERSGQQVSPAGHGSAHERGSPTSPARHGDQRQQRHTRHNHHLRKRPELLVTASSVGTTLRVTNGSAVEMTLRLGVVRGTGGIRHNETYADVKVEELALENNRTQTQMVGKIASAAGAARSERGKPLMHLLVSHPHGESRTVKLAIGSYRAMLNPTELEDQMRLLAPAHYWPPARTERKATPPRRGRRGSAAASDSTRKATTTSDGDAPPELDDAAAAAPAASNAVVAQLAALNARRVDVEPSSLSFFSIRQNPWAQRDTNAALVSGATNVSGSSGPFHAQQQLPFSFALTCDTLELAVATDENTHFEWVLQSPNATASRSAPSVTEIDFFLQVPQTTLSVRGGKPIIERCALEVAQAVEPEAQVVTTVRVREATVGLISDHVVALSRFAATFARSLRIIKGNLGLSASENNNNNPRHHHRSSSSASSLSQGPHRQESSLAFYRAGSTGSTSQLPPQPLTPLPLPRRIVLEGAGLCFFVGELRCVLFELFVESVDASASFDEDGDLIAATIARLALSLTSGVPHSTVLHPLSSAGVCVFVDSRSQDSSEVAAAGDGSFMLLKMVGAEQPSNRASSELTLRFPEGSSLLALDASWVPLWAQWLRGVDLDAQLAQFRAACATGERAKEVEEGGEEEAVCGERAGEGTPVGALGSAAGWSVAVLGLPAITVRMGAHCAVQASLGKEVTVALDAESVPTFRVGPVDLRLNDRPLLSDVHVAMAPFEANPVVPHLRISDASITLTPSHLVAAQHGLIAVRQLMSDNFTSASEPQRVFSSGLFLHPLQAQEEKNGEEEEEEEQNSGADRIKSSSSRPTLERLPCTVTVHRPKLGCGFATMKVMAIDTRERCNGLISVSIPIDGDLALHTAEEDGCDVLAVTYVARGGVCFSGQAITSLHEVLELEQSRCVTQSSADGRCHSEPQGARGAGSAITSVATGADSHVPFAALSVVKLRVSLAATSSPGDSLFVTLCGAEASLLPLEKSRQLHTPASPAPAGGELRATFKLGAVTVEAFNERVASLNGFSVSARVSDALSRFIVHCDAAEPLSVVAREGVVPRTSALLRHFTAAAPKAIVFDQNASPPPTPRATAQSFTAAKLLPTQQQNVQLRGVPHFVLSGKLPGLDAHVTASAIGQSGAEHDDPHHQRHRTFAITVSSVLLSNDLSGGTLCKNTATVRSIEVQCTMPSSSTSSRRNASRETLVTVSDFAIHHSTAIPADVAAELGRASAGGASYASMSGPGGGSSGATPPPPQRAHRVPGLVRAALAMQQQLGGASSGRTGSGGSRSHSRQVSFDDSQAGSSMAGHGRQASNDSTLSFDGASSAAASEVTAGPDTRWAATHSIETRWVTCAVSITSVDVVHDIIALARGSSSGTADNGAAPAATGRGMTGVESTLAGNFIYVIPESPSDAVDTAIELAQARSHSPPMLLVMCTFQRIEVEMLLLRLRLEQVTAKSNLHANHAVKIALLNASLALTEEQGHRARAVGSAAASTSVLLNRLSFKMNVGGLSSTATEARDQPSVTSFTAPGSPGAPADAAQAATTPRSTRAALQLRLPHFSATVCPARDSEALTQLVAAARQVLATPNSPTSTSTWTPTRRKLARSASVGSAEDVSMSPRSGARSSRRSARSDVPAPEMTEAPRDANRHLGISVIIGAGKVTAAMAYGEHVGTAEANVSGIQCQTTVFRSAGGRPFNAFNDLVHFSVPLVDVTLAYNGAVVLRYGASSMLSVLADRETFGPATPIFSVDGNIGQLQLFVTRPLLEMIKATAPEDNAPSRSSHLHRRESFVVPPASRRVSYAPNVASEEHQRHAAAESESPSVDSAPAGSGRRFSLLSLPRCKANLNGPHLNVNILEEALFSATVRGALDTRSGLVTESTASLDITTELKPIARLAAADQSLNANNSKSPERWSTAACISPLAWATVAIAVSPDTVEVRAGPLAIDTSATVPQCIKTLLAGRAPLSVMRVLAAPTPQQLSVDKLTFSCKYRMVSPQLTYIASVGAALGQLALHLDLDSIFDVEVIPPCSVHVLLNKVSLVADDDSGLLVSIGAVDGGVVLKQPPPQESMVGAFHRLFAAHLAAAASDNNDRSQQHKQHHQQQQRFTMESSNAQFKAMVAWIREHCQTGDETSGDSRFIPSLSKNYSQSFVPTPHSSSSFYTTPSQQSDSNEHVVDLRDIAHCIFVQRKFALDIHRMLLAVDPSLLATPVHAKQCRQSASSVLQWTLYVGLHHSKSLGTAVSTRSIEAAVVPLCLRDLLDLDMVGGGCGESVAWASGLLEARERRGARDLCVSLQGIEINVATGAGSLQQLSVTANRDAVHDALVAGSWVKARHEQLKSAELTHDLVAMLIGRPAVFAFFKRQRPTAAAIRWRVAVERIVHKLRHRPMPRTTPTGQQPASSSARRLSSIVAAGEADIASAVSVESVDSVVEGASDSSTPTASRKPVPSSPQRKPPALLGFEELLAREIDSILASGKVKNRYLRGYLSKLRTYDVKRVAWGVCLVRSPQQQQQEQQQGRQGAATGQDRGRIWRLELLPRDGSQRLTAAAAASHLVLKNFRCAEVSLEVTAGPTYQAQFAVSVNSLCFRALRAGSVKPQDAMPSNDLNVGISSSTFEDGWGGDASGPGSARRAASLIMFERLHIVDTLHHSQFKTVLLIEPLPRASAKCDEATESAAQSPDPSRPSPRGGGQHGEHADSLDPFLQTVVMSGSLTNSTIVDAFSKSAPEPAGAAPQLHTSPRLIPPAQRTQISSVLISENGTVTVELQKVYCVASVSTRKYLPKLVIIPDGVMPLVIPERSSRSGTSPAESAAASTRPPPETAAAAAPAPAYEVRLASMCLILPEYYETPSTWVLSVEATDTVIKPEALAPEELGRFTGTRCLFGTLVMDVFEMDRAEKVPEYEQLPRLMQTTEPVELVIKNSTDKENVTRTWQFIRIDEKGEVHLAMSAMQYGKACQVTNAVMRHWAYDKYFVTEQRHFEHRVKVLGPWFVPGGLTQSDSRYFLPMTVSHPKQLHWGWYNCIRFDYDGTEKCPFYMHLNPLTHVVRDCRGLLAKKGRSPVASPAECEDPPGRGAAARSSSPRSQAPRKSGGDASSTAGGTSQLSNKERRSHHPERSEKRGAATVCILEDSAQAGHAAATGTTGGGDSVNVDYFTATMLPLDDRLFSEAVGIENCDPELVFAYVCPLDGRGQHPKAFYVSFVLCESSQQKEELIRDLEAALEKERAEPTIYRNKYSPEITWSDQRYAVGRMVVDLRDSAWDLHPGCTIEMQDFCYTQVNRQHDWEIHLFATSVDVTTYCGDAESSGPRASMQVQLGVTPGKALLTYNIVHTNKSPKAVDGCPKWGGVVRLDSLGVTLLGDGTVWGPSVAFLKRFGPAFGDGHSLLWPATYLERGGPQFPMDARYVAPWRFQIDSLEVDCQDETSSVLKLTGRGVDITTVTLTTEYYAYEGSVAALEACGSDGRQLLMTEACSPHSCWCTFTHRASIAYHMWHPDRANLASHTQCSVGATRVRLPVPHIVRKLQVYFDTGAPAPAGQGLFLRVARFAGIWEAQRSREALEAKQLAAASYPACNTFEISVGSFVAFAPEGIDTDTGGALSFDTLHLRNALRDSPCAADDSASRIVDDTLSAQCELKSLQCWIVSRATEECPTEARADAPAALSLPSRCQLIEPLEVCVRATDEVAKRSGWDAAASVGRMVVRLPRTAYGVLLNIAAAHTPPATAQAPQHQQRPQEHSPRSSRNGAGYAPTPGSAEGRTGQSRATGEQQQQPPASPPSQPFHPHVSGPARTVVNAKIAMEGADVLVINDEEGPLASLTVSAVTGAFLQRDDGSIDTHWERFALDVTDARGGIPLSDASRRILHLGDVPAANPDNMLLRYRKATTPAVSHTLMLRMHGPAVCVNLGLLAALRTFADYRRQKPMPSSIRRQSMSRLDERVNLRQHEQRLSRSRRNLRADSSTRQLTSEVSFNSANTTTDPFFATTNTDPFDTQCRGTRTTSRPPSTDGTGDDGDDVWTHDRVITCDLMLERDTYLHHRARMLFTARGRTLHVNGQHHCVYLTADICSGGETPDNMPWNIIVDHDTRVVFHDITLVYRGTLRAHTHLSKGAAIDVRQANRAFVTVLQDSDSDSDDSDQQAEALQDLELQELEASVASFGSPTLSNFGSSVGEESLMQLENVDIESVSGISASAAVRLWDLDITITRLQLVVPSGTENDQQRCIYLVADAEVQSSATTTGLQHHQLRLAEWCVGGCSLGLLPQLNLSAAQMASSVVSSALIRLRRLHVEVKGDRREQLQRFVVSGALDTLALTASLVDIKLLLAVHGHVAAGLALILPVPGSAGDGCAPQAPAPKRRAAGATGAAPEAPSPSANRQQQQQQQLKSVNAASGKQTHLVRLTQLDVADVSFTFLEKLVATGDELPLARVSLVELTAEGQGYAPSLLHYGGLDAVLAVHMYNPIHTGWEPFLEDYGLMVRSSRSKHHGHFSTSIDIHAVNVLNVNVTNMFLREGTSALYRLLAAWRGDDEGVASSFPDAVVERERAWERDGLSRSPGQVALQHSTLADMSTTATVTARLGALPAAAGGSSGAATPSGHPFGDVEMVALHPPADGSGHRTTGTSSVSHGYAPRPPPPPLALHRLHGDAGGGTTPDPWRTDIGEADSVAGHLTPPASTTMTAACRLRRAATRYVLRNDTAIECTIEGMFVIGEDRVVEEVRLTAGGAGSLLEVHLPERDALRQFSVHFAGAPPEHVRLTQPGHHYISIGGPSRIVLEVSSLLGTVVCLFRSALRLTNLTPHRLIASMGAWKVPLMPSGAAVAEDPAAAAASAVSSGCSAGVPVSVLDTARASPAMNRWSIELADPAASALSASIPGGHRGSCRSQAFSVPEGVEMESFSIEVRDGSNSVVAVYQCTVIPLFVPHSSTVAEHIVTIMTPVVLENLLPFKLHFVFAEDAAAGKVLQRGALASSQKVPCHCGTPSSGLLFFAIRFESLQGRLLHPRKVIEVRDGEQRLKLVDCAAGQKEKLLLHALIEADELGATRRIKVFAPYVLYNCIDDHLTFLREGRMIAGSLPRSVQSSTHEFESGGGSDQGSAADGKTPRPSVVVDQRQLSAKVVVPLLTCAGCMMWLSPHDAICSCRHCGTFAHLECLNKISGVNCLYHVLRDLPANQRSNQTLLFAPPTFDLFGGKMQLSFASEFNESLCSGAFPYDAVNMSGCVGCRVPQQLVAPSTAMRASVREGWRSASAARSSSDSPPPRTALEKGEGGHGGTAAVNISDKVDDEDPHDSAMVIVRSVGVAVSIAPAQFLRSKLITCAAFAKIANTTPHQLLIVVPSANDTPIISLQPGEEKELVLTVPPSFNLSTLLKDGTHPKYALQLVNGPLAGARSLPFSIHEIGRTMLMFRSITRASSSSTAQGAKAPATSTSAHGATGRPPSLVLAVSSVQVGATIRCVVTTQIVPPIRIANNTWSTVEYRQDFKDPKRATVDVAEPFAVVPYFFEHHEERQRLVLRVSSDGMVVRVGPSAVGSEAHDEDLEVIEKGSGRFRVHVLVGADSVVIAVEEHHVQQLLRLENIRFVDSSKDAAETHTLRLVAKYAGVTAKSAPIKGPQAPYDFSEGLNKVQFSMYNSRDVLRLRLEKTNLAIFSDYGFVEFHVGRHRAKSGQCALEVLPPPDAEHTGPIGTLTFSWRALNPDGSEVGGPDDALECVVSDASRPPVPALRITADTSIGISLIGVDALRQREDAYVFLSGLSAIVEKSSGSDIDLELTMAKLQLDNQRGNAIFDVALSTPDIEVAEEACSNESPVVEGDGDPHEGAPSTGPSPFSAPPPQEGLPTAAASAAREISPTYASSEAASSRFMVLSPLTARKMQHLNRIKRTRGRSGKKKVTRFLHLSVAQLNVCSASIVKALYGGCCIQEMIATLDDIFLKAVLDVIPSEFLRAASQDFNEAARVAVGVDAPLPADTAVERRLFMQALQLHPLLINITFVAARETSTSGNPIMVLLETLGMAVQSIDHAPIRIKALLLTNAFGPLPDVAALITRHFRAQFLTELYKILGAMEFIGNPTSLLTNIGEGIFDMFYEPAMGLVHSPQAFARGIVRGVSSLVSKTICGATTTIKGVVGTIANGVAQASFDEEWQRHRRRKLRQRPKHLGDGMKKAALHFGRGIADGVTGIVLQPIRGARKGGVLGFFKGIGRGVAGLVVKPLTGALDSITIVSGAIRTAVTDEYHRLRIRPPRVFDHSHLLLDFNFEAAEANEILICANDGKYWEDSYVHHHHGTSATYVISLQRIVCTKLRTEQLLWAATYPTITRVSDSLDRASGEVTLHIHLHRSFFNMSGSELVIECRSIAECRAMLHRIKVAFPPISLDLRYVTPAAPEAQRASPELAQSADAPETHRGVSIAAGAETARLMYAGPEPSWASGAASESQRAPLEIGGIRRRRIELLQRGAENAKEDNERRLQIKAAARECCKC